MAGKTARGASSPAKPTFIILEELLTTSAWTSESMMEVMSTALSERDS